MTNPLTLHKTAPHWTDSHILFEENNEKFIAYDEAGLEHSRWDTLNEARDALVIYGATELANVQFDTPRS